MANALAPVTALLASVFGLSTAHAAEDLCVPDTQQGPQWWNPALSANAKEARWSGATVRTQTTGPYAASVRTIWKPALETVYFEFSVQNDRALDADDVVLVALGDASGTLPELFIRFAPVAGCGNVGDCDGNGAALDPSAVEFSEATFGGTSITWSPMSTSNPSADFVVDHPWVVVEPVGSAFDWTFSVALQVPVDGSGEIGPDQRIYGNAVMIEPGPTSDTLFEFPLLCTPSSVTSNDCLIYAGPGADVPFDLPIGNMTDSWPVMESGGCGDVVLVPLP